MLIDLLFIFLAALIALFVFIILKFRNSRQKLILEIRKLTEANQKLAETNRHYEKINESKDKLFSVIAHDLRNPFNALLGLSEVLQKNIETYSIDKIKKYNCIINKSARNIHGQLENLLEWARANSGKIYFNPEIFDICPLALNVTALLEINALQKRIDIICNIEHHTFVYADKNTVTSVLRNLLDNAIKFTPEDGKIIVSSKKINNFVEVSVADTGLGMSNNDIEKILSDIIFTRKGTQEEKGSGLGLLLCREFIEMNGGKMEVTSEPYKGSIFQFTLPYPISGE